MSLVQPVLPTCLVCRTHTAKRWPSSTGEFAGGMALSWLGWQQANAAPYQYAGRQVAMCDKSRDSRGSSEGDGGKRGVDVPLGEVGWDAAAYAGSCRWACGES